MQRVAATLIGVLLPVAGFAVSQIVTAFADGCRTLALVLPLWAPYMIAYVAVKQPLVCGAVIAASTVMTLLVARAVRWRLRLVLAVDGVILAATALIAYVVTPKNEFPNNCGP